MNVATFFTRMIEELNILIAYFPRNKTIASRRKNEVSDIGGTSVLRSTIVIATVVYFDALPLGEFAVLYTRHAELELAIDSK